MTEIAGAFEVALNGRPYRAVQEAYRRRFLDVIRQQADSSGEPSERSLNPNDLWRRSQNDWIMGSGQRFYDDDESIKKRFNESDGVTPWVKGEMSLLPSASRVDSMTGTIGAGVVAQGELWVAQDTTLEHWNGTAWGTSGAVPQQIQNIATDGTNIYIACRNAGATAGGVYVIGEGSTTPVLLNTVIPDRVAYIRGRLMVAAGYSLYNITDVGDTAPPSAITAPAINAEWTWDAFGAGQSYIYVAGSSGDLSLIYRISIREDGSALTAPVVATQMPDGEFVVSITSYLQFIILGTTRGVRVAVPQSGSLTYGALIPTARPVYAAEPQAESVWFGDDGGLSRADLRRFITGLELTPAYANDLQSGNTGNVLSATTWGDRRLWIVEDVGVFWEDDTQLEVQGSFSTGTLTFGLPDNKQFRFIDLVSDITGTDTVDVTVSYDGAAPVAVGSLTANDPVTSFELTGKAERAEFFFTFNGSGTTSPVLRRFTVRALPAPKRTEQIEVALDLRESVLALNGSMQHMDVMAEYSLLRQLVLSGDTVTYQEFDESYDVAVENLAWGPDLDVTDRHASWEGMCVATLKVYG